MNADICKAVNLEKSEPLLTLTYVDNNGVKCYDFHRMIRIITTIYVESTVFPTCKPAASATFQFTTTFDFPRYSHKKKATCPVIQCHSRSIDNPQTIRPIEDETAAG